jgi:hemin uptake protein HemP
MFLSRITQTILLLLCLLFSTPTTMPSTSFNGGTGGGIVIIGNNTPNELFVVVGIVVGGLLFASVTVTAFCYLLDNLSTPKKIPKSIPSVLPGQQQNNIIIRLTALLHNQEIDTFTNIAGQQAIIQSHNLFDKPIEITLTPDDTIKAIPLYLVNNQQTYLSISFKNIPNTL